MARDAAQDAEAFRIDCFGEIVFERSLSGRRQGQLKPRKIFPDVPSWFRIASAFPEAAEIGMSIGCARRWLRTLRVLRGQTSAGLLLRDAGETDKHERQQEQ
jgi:hypothetical protein